MDLISAAFVDEGPIPKRYSCQGKNVSPPFIWLDPPPATRAFALVMEDPDAPMRTFTHWVLYDLPSDIRELPEDIPQDKTAPYGAKQGQNSFGRLGYDGPCPPNGPFHRYRFTLYALSHPTGLHAGARKEDVMAAVQERLIEKAELRGRYQRVSLGTYVRALIHH